MGQDPSSKCRHRVSPPAISGSALAVSLAGGLLVGRATVIPKLPKERLVIIRESFLKLCDGDHCAAALLNDFAYWHDWCVDRERQDALMANQAHQVAERYRFWKSNEDLEK